MDDQVLSTFARYGVRLSNPAGCAIDQAAESLALVGYAVVESGLSQAELHDLSERFDRLHRAYRDRHGQDRLTALDETDSVRCPLADDPAFLSLATNPLILALGEQLLGPGFILNQQNGIINPPRGRRYSQSAFHRDLPYQHFVSSRPLAINALFCLDPFTSENGASLVIPASHKLEAFPSDPVVTTQVRQVEAPAGSFLVLDAMTYHCGGPNRTDRPRRAINHVYSIAMLRQQIDLPAYLGDGFSTDPALRQLLGFRHPTVRSVEEFLDHRARRRPGDMVVGGEEPPV
ncbi:MAG: phytanoyl-CoA dioxygenase family protein [Caulobacteraceae bacterium]|nr:phytanoyl-CoA dioxygenase family protein [Caulobacteraceae bacterium]